MAGMAAPVMPATGDPGGIWPAWNYIYTTYSSTAGSTLTLNSTDPWPYWNAGYTNGTLLYTEVSSGTTLITGPQWQNWNLRYEQAAEYTAEQRAAQEERRRLVDAQQAEWRRQRETERARQAVVNSRAEELLLALLTDEQARTYREHGWFEVRGSKGGRWRIRNSGQAGNVDLMPEIGNERDASFCCHPPGGLPDPDAHLAQMLHLVTDEDGFRETANIAYRRPPRPALREVA